MAITFKPEHHRAAVGTGVALPDRGAAAAGTPAAAAAALLRASAHAASAWVGLRRGGPPRRSRACTLAAAGVPLAIYYKSPSKHYYVPFEGELCYTVALCDGAADRTGQQRRMVLQRIMQSSLLFPQKSSVGVQNTLFANNVAVVC